MTKKWDYMIESEPGFKDDITYCNNIECTQPCWRHYSKIDWSLPKNQFLGCSIAEFGPVCESYKPTLMWQRK